MRGLCAGIAILMLACSDTPPPDTLGAVDSEAARRLCRGSPVRARPDDVARANEIMSGQLRLAPHPPVPLPDDPTWKEDPLGDDNWRFQYHNLAWLDTLRRVARATGDEAMRGRYRELLRDWIESHPYDHPLPAPKDSDDYSWFDMAVGWRAVILTCGLAELGTEPWLVDALEDHGNALADPRQYVRHGNHALHQNSGLLVLACTGDNQRWRDLALARNESLLLESVDAKGVSLEGSASYQSNNYLWWSDAAAYLDACQLTPSSTWDRIDRMPDVLAHMTAPDGRPVLLGDSIYRPYSKFVSAETAWAVTRGAEGEPPRERVVVYDRAGYVFGRSGWGTRRPVVEESHWSLRFGPPLEGTVHGHEDHGSLTLSAYGDRILWDQGLYAYGGGDARSYVRSNAAHNAVDVEGAGYDAAAMSPLRIARVEAGFAYFEVDVETLEETDWTRAVFASTRHHYLIVRDRIRRDGPGRIIQRWHLGSDQQVEIDGQRIDTLGSGANASFFWLGGAPTLAVRAGKKAPMIGWRSLEYRELVSVPVLEARVSAKREELVTVILARPEGEAPSTRDVVRHVVSEDAHIITVRQGGRCETVLLGEERAEVMTAMRECPRVVR